MEKVSLVNNFINSSAYKVMNDKTNLYPFVFEFIHETAYFLEKVENETIIIPLEKGKIRQYQQDVRGCRIFDWNLLNLDQIKVKAGLKNSPAHHVIMPHISEHNCCWSDTCPEVTLVNHPEEYTKMLNVTYLVDEEFIHKWVTGLTLKEEKNIARKEVQDCSVSELLFAINKKLDKR